MLVLIDLVEPGVKVNGIESRQSEAIELATSCKLKYLS